MKQQRSDSRNIKPLGINSIAALFIGAAMLFYGCEKTNIEEIKAFISSDNLPVIEARNFETLFTDSGQVRFLLKTPRLLSFEEDGHEYYEFPEGMKVVKYDANQRIISSITANYAKQFVSESKWEARNNVIATNDQGDTLKTEQLFWEDKAGRIYTDEFVRIIRPDQIMTGIGFTSDQSMKNWEIKQPKGTIYIEVNNQNPPAIQPQTQAPAQQNTPAIENQTRDKLHFEKQK